MRFSTRRIAMLAQISPASDSRSISPLPTRARAPEMRRPNIRCQIEVRLRPGEKTSGNQNPSTPRKIGLKRDASVTASPNQLRIDAPPVLLPFLPPLPLPPPSLDITESPDQSGIERKTQTERRRVGTRSQPGIVTCSSRHDNRDLKKHKPEGEPGESEDSRKCGNKEMTYNSTVIRWKQLVSEQLST